ncbi:MAG: hypothetical protein VCE12_11075, partial [Candidatus Latescibacterota bacterium]
MILHSGLWELAVLSERDPGEGRWHDHVVGSAQRTAPGMDLTVDHLRPAFGQGLLFGRGRSTGVPVPAPRREGPSLGYRSATEGHTIEGAVVRRRGAAWTAALLAGRLLWDARIDSAGVARSLPDGGDHTGSGATTEPAAWHRHRRPLDGTRASHRCRPQRTTADLSAGRRPTARETPYAFHGRGQWSGSVDVHARRGLTRWYGAAARAGQDRHAGRCVGAGRSRRAPGPDRSLVFAGLLCLGWRRQRCWHGKRAWSYGAGSWSRLVCVVDATSRPASRWRQPLPSWKRGGGVHAQTRRG